MEFCSNYDPFPWLCNNGSAGISNVEEGESNQECQLLRAHEDRSSDVFDDNFMDAPKEKDILIE